jgi:hypothetical protein
MLHNRYVAQVGVTGFEPTASLRAGQAHYKLPVILAPQSDNFHKNRDGGQQAVIPASYTDNGNLSGAGRFP